MQRVIAGTTFSYESFGDGVPIVLLHGMPADHGSMMPRFEPLFADTRGPWRRIYPDLPGAGATSGVAGIEDLDGYVDVLSSFIDEETGGAPTVLVGTSFGGFMALAYAQRRPERVAGLALVVPTFHDPTTPRPSPTVLVEEPGALDGEPPPFVGMFGAVATVHTRAVRDVLKRDVVPGVQRADRALVGRMLATRLTGEEQLKTLRFEGPALVVTGRQDSVCGYLDARAFAEQLPRATYVMLDRAGHALQIEQEALLRAHVREWLARVREALGEGYEA